jgi:hypothetical protein
VNAWGVVASAARKKKNKKQKRAEPRRAIETHPFYPLDGGCLLDDRLLFCPEASKMFDNTDNKDDDRDCHVRTCCLSGVGNDPRTISTLGHQ